MTHAEEIATIRRNHREDLQLIFGEIKSVNESVTKIETELPHLARRESIIPIIEGETKKQFALHVAECENSRNKNAGNGDRRKAKHDWVKIVRNTAYLAAIGGSVTTAILAWVQ